MFKSLLRDWGLEKYIEKFEDEEIDDESFPILLPEAIKSIFTKGGPYSKFLNKYNEWKQSSSASNLQTASELAVVEYGEDTLEADEYCSPQANGSLTNESNHELHDPLILTNYVRNSFTEEVLPMRSSTPSKGPSKKKRLIPSCQADGSLTKESSQEFPDPLILTNYVRNSFTEEVLGSSTLNQDSPPKKKRLISSSQVDFPMLNEGFIHEALKDNFNGTIIISEYKKKGYLSPLSQKHLTECVLLKEVKGDIEKRVSADRYKELAALIVQYFPCESESTYYVPYHKDIEGKKFCASGKLVDLLYNIRRRAKKAGLVPKSETFSPINYPS